MCAYGKRLYDEWSKYGHIIQVLEVRRAFAWRARESPEIPLDLDYVKTVNDGIVAQQTFLGHQSFCSECSNSWGNPAGSRFSGAKT